MKKNLLLIATLLTVLASKNSYSETDLEIGENIYKKAFGRGCGTCHDISVIPDITSLIQSGELGIDSFTNTMFNGSNGGMPKAIDSIMGIRSVQQAEYTENQAINALYRYIKEKEGVTSTEPPTESPDPIIPTTEDNQDNSIILNQDFSFNIPLVKYRAPNGTTSYYDVDFIFVPKNNKLLFGVTKAIETEPSRIDSFDSSNAIILNRDFSFNIPSVKYTDVDSSTHYYKVDFIFSPADNKFIFELVNAIELQNSK